MKINVRQEAATEASETVEAKPARTCLWVLSDSGETVSTTYLEAGQEVSLDTEGAVSTGETTETEQPPPAEAPPETPEGGETPTE